MFWHNKRVVVVGDSRVQELDKENKRKPKDLQKFCRPGMTILEAIAELDRILDENVIYEREPIDATILVALHCDFTT
ncbi:UNVERIFIED_CONTAM: hypothetical protein RMT77_012160 [Armadillidium vulgare]